MTIAMTGVSKTLDMVKVMTNCMMQSLSLMIFLWGICIVYGGQETQFYSGILCDLDSRLIEGCSTPVSNSSTVHACVFGCSKDSECVGASVVNESKCFHHQTCTSITGCKKHEIDHKYMSKQCGHGGVWDPAISACTCGNGWVGDHCLDLPSKCLDLIDLGRYSQTGEFRTYLNLFNAQVNDKSHFSVICYINPHSKYWQVRVFANMGKGDFSKKTWADYKNGFFVDHSNYWIGLENWHAVSSVGITNLIIYLENGRVFRDYNGVYIQDDSHNFSFTFTTTGSWYRNVGIIDNTFPDCLGSVQNSSFSTVDNDNDGVSSENCAQRVGSGWWFSGSCNSPCNLLGKSPEDWPLFPSDQWMRLDGINPVLMEEHGNIGFFAYLT